MKNKIIIYSLLAFMLLGSALYASDYIVGPEDILTINVFKEKDFTGDFKVNSNGMLNYSVIGEISVDGKTEDEIGKDLKEILARDYLVNPKVSVTVKEYNSKKVMVLGDVGKPGVYSLKKKTYVLDIISQAGGMKKEGSTRIVVLRKEEKKEEPETPGKEQEKNTEDKKIEDKQPIDKEPDEQPGKARNLTPIIIDYSKILSGGDLTQNIEIIGGDIVNVPKANEVYVFGSVQKPGPVSYSDSMGVLQAITLAGGPTQEASQGSTYILRMGIKGEEQKIKVNLSKVLKQKSKNVAVKPNDVIVVPESFF